MRIRARRWFREIWPFSVKRRALIGQYAAIGAQYRLFLADVALRGRVFSDLDVRGDRDQTLINIGRRDLALEIIETCNTPADQLFALVERAPTKGENHD